MKFFRCGWRVYGCRRVFRSEWRRCWHELFGCRFME
jgi:hypothetical protein